MLITLFRDRLPRGLCFPLGLEILSARLPLLVQMNGAVVFTWQSTWASQIFDATRGEHGLLAVMQCRLDLPRMRINAQKVQPVPSGSGVIASVFAVASQHQKQIQLAFADSGAALVSEHLEKKPLSSSQIFYYDLAGDRFCVSKGTYPVW